MPKRALSMKVGDVMTRHAEVIGPDGTLVAAAAKMRDTGVGILPVMRDSHFEGMVSDRDIVVRGIAAGMNPHVATVREVMTPEMVFCRVDQTIEEVAVVMEEQGVRRLAVLDRAGHLVGVLSVDDIAMVLGDEELVGEILGRIVEPAPPGT